MKDRIKDILSGILAYIIGSGVWILSLVLFLFRKQYKHSIAFLYDLDELTILGITYKCYDKGKINNEDNFRLRKSNISDPEFEATRIITMTIFGIEKIFMKIYFRNCAYASCKKDCDYCYKLDKMMRLNK